MYKPNTFTYNKLRQHLLNYRKQYENEMNIAIPMHKNDELIAKGHLRMLDILLDDLDSAPDIIESENLRIVKNNYLICFKEKINDSKETGRYTCEAENMKEAVEMLKSISNNTLEILSISTLDDSIPHWTEL